MRFVIATKNQGKIEGARRALNHYFKDVEIEWTPVNSDVSEQLVNDVINTNLSEVMNNIYTKNDERHNKGGGIQSLTHEKITRIDLTESAFIMALTKYINGEVWK